MLSPIAEEDDKLSTPVASATNKSSTSLVNVFKPFLLNKQVETESDHDDSSDDESAITESAHASQSGSNFRGDPLSVDAGARIRHMLSPDSPLPKDNQDHLYVHTDSPPQSFASAGRSLFQLVDPDTMTSAVQRPPVATAVPLTSQFLAPPPTEVFRSLTNTHSNPRRDTKLCPIAGEPTSAEKGQRPLSQGRNDLQFCSSGFSPSFTPLHVLFGVCTLADSMSDKCASPSKITASLSSISQSAPGQFMQQSLTCVQTIKFHTGPVWAAKFSPNGEYLATAGTYLRRREG
jgi:hypothetical protein